MPLFCDESETSENGVKYYVFRAKPISHIVLILSLLLITVHVYFLRSYKEIFGGYYFHIGWFLLGLFTLLLIIKGYEYRKTILPWFRKKKIIKKGGNTLSFSSPQEIWVEK